MADTSIYSMGQIRYKTIDEANHKYMNEIKNFNAHSIKTETLGGLPYQDIILYNDNLENFSQYESYYLKLKFLRNLSYDMTFDLKLVNFNKDTGKITNLNQYQEIRRFVVAKDSSGILDYRNVILYPRQDEIENGEDSVAVSIIRKERDKAKIGEVYQFTYIKNKDKPDEETIIEYRIKKENQQDDVVIGEKNIQTFNLSWIQNEADEYFETGIVFSNKVNNINNFNAILLELNREPEDDDILHPAESPEYRGRYLNAAKIETQCYKINNLVPESVPEGVSSFNSIGVWSHPNSIMTINGEEIRIGQSGYYELNNFEITNFGIVVDGAKDKFSLDYQYKIS